MGINVFLSYARSDAGLAARIAESLRRRGVTAPLVDLDVNPGEDWSVWLRKALQDSDAVVALVSDASLNSPWVMNEIGAALALGKRIVALRAGKQDLPFSSAMSHMAILDTEGRSDDDIATSIQHALAT